MVKFDVMSVREMIDSGFGETDSSCPVDFNKVGSVLFILARRMQLLKRNFKVTLADVLKKHKPKATYMVTEIKIHTLITKSAKYKAGVVTGELLPSDERLTGKIKRYTRKRSRTTSLDRTPSAKHAGDDSSSGMSSDGDFSTQKSAAHKRSSETYTSAMSRAQRRTDEDYAKDPGAQGKARKYFDEILTAKQRESGKYSDEMSPTRRLKREKYSYETSLSDQRKAGKYSDERFSSRQRKSGKYSDDMSPDERKKYSGKMSPAERCRGGKYSDQSSSYEQSKSYSPIDEFSSESAISRKSRSEKRFAQRGKADELNSQKDTAGRWKETGSNERKSTYGAHHTDDDMEEQHETIFVVTTTQSGRKIREPVVNPVATQEQFNRLLERTRALQKKFGITKKSNTKWDDIGNSTSITHPKAALNMAARLDVAETKLARMLDIVTQVAHQVPGIDVDAYFDENSFPSSTTSLSTPGAITTTVNPTDAVTHGQFVEELRRMRDGIDKTLRYAMNEAGLGKCGRTMSSTEAAVNQLYGKFSDIEELNLVAEEFGRKVVAVDERLTFKMTTFNDDLMQMQTELEVAVDKMTDAALSPKEDSAAVALITDDFIDYAKNLALAGDKQIRLKEEQEAYLKNLKIVEEKIKVLFNQKCTRDEMFEALNDKLSLSDINGILTENQFHSTNTEIKKILQNLYLAIFTKECSWQRRIDELKDTIEEGAESYQLKTLMESMGKCLTTMDKQMDDMFAVVGPPRICPTDKTIERDNYCLSCGAPVETKKTKLSLKLWQEALSKSDAVKLPNEEIAVLCIPGQPIPHPLEQNSFVCQHDCGDTVTKEKVFDLFIKELTPTRTKSDNSVEEENT